MIFSIISEIIEDILALSTIGVIRVAYNLDKKRSILLRERRFWNKLLEYKGLPAIDFPLEYISECLNIPLQRIFQLWVNIYNKVEKSRFNAGGILFTFDVESANSTIDNVIRIITGVEKYSVMSVFNQHIQTLFPGIVSYIVVIRPSAGEYTLAYGDNISTISRKEVEYKLMLCSILNNLLIDTIIFSDSIHRTYEYTGCNTYRKGIWDSYTLFNPY
jgi:hypothetical protein